MKFARFLESNQTPEWKKAYIDYRGLKKRIASIKKAAASSQPTPLPEDPPSQASNRPAMTRYDSFGHTGPLRAPTSARWRSLTTARNTPSPNPKSFDELLTSLPPYARDFFAALDLELQKVETFYKAREQEWITQFEMIKEQLQELAEHRKVYHAAKTNAETRWVATIPRAWGNIVGLVHARGGKHSNRRLMSPFRKAPPLPANYSVDDHLSPDRDPDLYQHAKKRLKRAVLEFHRGLELLKNYRIMNKTGFRKAVKKFEKATSIRTFDLYMTDKVEPCSFASEIVLDNMLREVEDLYCIRFEGGDHKKAKQRLRSPFGGKSHHISTFRAGLFLGFALPALLSGIHLCSLQDTREAIPQWEPLLFAYGVLFIPVLFALLVGLNIWAWAHARINYSFIFELDARHIDSRQYAELPALILFTLCSAFWFSFMRLGSPSIPPTTWPIIWIGFVLALLSNPLPIISHGPRMWLIRNIAKLPLAGINRVDFTDFWMGDQFCSLSFTLTNLYFIGCAYQDGWEDPWAHCQLAGDKWPLPFILSSLPSIIRLMQCIKRFIDSDLRIHLINAGKYCAGVLAFAAYYAWRHNGSRYDTTFILFCLTSVLNSTYTSAWDLLMDWSFFDRKTVRPFLRPDLFYASWPSLYYIAGITNIAIRFIWVIYVPVNGPSGPVRSFTAAFLEMLRRIQWNFFRVENEHIGNADQYRVTREIPLPYTIDDDDDGSHSDDERPHGRSVQMGALGDSGGGSGACHRDQEQPIPSSDTRPSGTVP